MPRKARKKSSTGIHHVVIRGLDHQIMFEEPKDYKKYLDLLARYSEECSFDILAYCLMSNHTHLLVKANDIPIDTIFRKINTSYSIWFNMKYQRTGHLQQDRYYSEPVENISYLLTVIRYIHFNPTKAGLESRPGDSYLWSSIHEYTQIKNISNIINVNYILNYISKSEFISLNQTPSEEKCLDIDNIIKKLPDDVAKELIEEISGCRTCSEFQKLPYLVQKNHILTLHDKGISIRQLNRLTGCSKGTITRIVTKGHSL